MPDLSLLPILCEVLEISLAELLKGERISSQTITKEEASEVLSSLIHLVRERLRGKKLLAAIVSAVITLFCMVAVYNYEFPINITSTTDLEKAVNEYHFTEEADVNILERQTIGNRLIVLYAQNEHPACGGFAVLEKGIFGKYRILSTDNFTWPLYNRDIITVSGTRYLLVCGVNELAGVAFYEVDVTKTDGEVQVFGNSVESGSFIHITEIEDGAVTAPRPFHYFDSEGQEISEKSLLSVHKEDPAGTSSGTGTAETWLIYVLEFIIFVLGLIFVHYFLTESNR